MTTSKKIRVSKKVVIFKLQIDRIKMDDRKCLSEHPFGTIKRTIGESFFNLGRMYKIEGEMALYCLTYNLRRVMTLLLINERW